MSFSIPPSPPNFRGNTFNPATYPSTTNTGLTVQGGLSYFVSYPQAQGRVTLLDTNVTGNLNTSDNIFLNNAGNYIQFADGTRQTTATQDFSGYAFTDVSNVFFDLNTFNANIAIGGTPNINYLQFPDGTKQYTSSSTDINTVYNDVSNTFLSGTIQTFQGSNTTSNLTAPFQFSNVSSGEFGTLYVDPSPNNDLTLYSNQSNGGLTIRNVNGNSCTLNPLNNNANFYNPIVSTLGITGNTLTTSTNLTFSTDSSVQTTAFTTSLLNPYAPLASPALTGSATLNSYTIATTNLLTPYAPLASPALTGNPTAPTPSATDNDTTIATTAYVTTAISNIPAVTGYAVLNTATSQTFTGPITFSGTTTGVTQPVNTNNTTLATTAFVTTNGPIYTTSSFTNNSTQAPYISIVPSPCTVISTYIAQTNVVYFNNVNFTVSVTGNPLFVLYLGSLVFNVNPFPNSPPAQTSGYINVLYNNTNTIYSSNYVWSVNTLNISWPTGLSNYANSSFTINLQNLGAFQA